MTFQQAYEQLNNQQKKAVDAIEGPVMVVAGPGTGKTQVLALRIANILQKQTDIGAENILCLTFTEAGTKAMRERLKQFIGNDAYSVAIHTFHSFANEIIQSFSEYFDIEGDPIQIDELGKLKLINQILDENSAKFKNLRPFSNPYSRTKDILNDISLLKKEGVTSKRLRDENEKARKYHEENPVLAQRGKNKGQPTNEWKRTLERFDSVEELALAYEKYQEKLTKDGLYDYEDMIMYVIDAFRENDQLLAYFQEKYLYIHVDEYQDTNGAQNEIIKQLGSFDSSPNIFVVGDDDQAIYRFQGANLNNILFFSESFNDVSRITITDNYRSTQNILDVAQDVISENQQRLVNQFDDIQKNLKAANPDRTDSESKKEKTELHEFKTWSEEDVFIAEKIKELTKKGTKFSEIAILYRNNQHGEELAESLNKFQIPVSLSTPKTVFDSTLVTQLIDLLRVIELYSKNEEMNLYRVLMYDFWNIDPVDIYRLVGIAKKERTNLLELILDTKNSDNDFSKINIEKIKKVVELIFRWHKLNSNLVFPKLIEVILEESGILDFALNTKDQEDDDASKTFDDVLALSSFFEYIKTLSKVEKELDISSFLKDLDLIREKKIRISLPKVESGKDAVNLLTAHSSKGLEFKYVFIAKATQKNWGKKRASRSIVPKELLLEIIDDDTNSDELNDKNEVDTKIDISLEEERRLFFVAMTRAEQKLFLTYAEEYPVENNQKPNLESISSFIEEIGENELEEFKEKDTINEESQKSKIENVVNLLKSGDPKALSTSEKEFLIEQISSFKLSATALNTYLKDPKEFKEKYLIRVPEATTKHLALGSAVHAAMERWNRNLIRRRGDVTSPLARVDELINVYEKRLYKDFFGDEEYEETLEEGRKVLKDYFEHLDSEDILNLHMPVEVEYYFGGHSVLLESSKKDEDPIPLTGRIDKVELLNENTNEVKIVDYKTGRPKTAGQIKGNTSDSRGDIWRQLVFYKLLGDLDPNFKSKEKFNSPKYNIQQVEVDFLRQEKNKSFRKETFEVTEKDVEELVELIWDVMRKIRELQF